MVTLKSFSPFPVRFVLKTTKGLVVVSALFSLVMSVLMIANYVQLSTAKPLDSPSLLALRAVFSANQAEEELKNQIRALDLMARKAFFTRTWQLKTGGYLLGCGIGVLLLSLRSVSFFGKRLPNPQSQLEAGSWLSTVQTRRAFAITGLILAAVATVAMILSLSIQHNIFAEEFTAESSDPSDQAQYRERAAENWPGFRGLNGIGHGAPQSFPIEWDGRTGENIRWMTALPLSGFNSPIVWGDRVFLSGAEVREGDVVQEVYCLDALNGEILWTRTVGPFSGSPTVPPRVDPETGYAAPTMTSDGRGVYAIFATGDVAGFSHDGDFLWGFNLGVPDLLYGYSSSPLVYGNLLIIQYDHSQSAEVMALETQTGRTVWSTRRDVGESYASPILIASEEETKLVLNANPLFAAYDPDSGDEVWLAGGVDIYGDVTVTPGYGSGTIVSFNPLPVTLGNVFAVDAASGELLWDIFLMDLGSNPVSSPLLVDTYVFIATESPVIMCLDADTGEEIWSRDFYEDGDAFYSSPIYAGGKVYLIDRGGTMRIFSPASSFEFIGSPEIYEPTDATPAFASGRIFIRGDKHLFCVEALDG